MLGSNLNSSSQVDVIRDELKFDIASDVDLNSPLMFGDFLDSHLNYWCLSQKSLEEMATWMLHILSCDPHPTGYLTGSLIPAGYTYIGQMITHDVVQNTSSADKRKVTPCLNLDSIYPEVSSDEFEEYLDDDGRFHLNSKGNWEDSWDYARDAQGTKTQGRAKILEPRNDENIILSQIVVEWMKFHNKAIEYLRGCDDDKARKPSSKKENYIKARKFGILVFQYFVVNDYLRHILSPSIYQYYFEAGNSHSRCKKAFYNSFKKSSDSVPLEFSHAVFRFGHSTVRDNYVLSCKNDKCNRMHLDKMLRKNKPLANEHVIEWDRFFFSENESERAIEKNLNFGTAIDIFIATDLGSIAFDEFRDFVLDKKLTKSSLNRLYRHMYEGRVEGDSFDSQKGGSTSNFKMAMIECEIEFSELTKGLVNLVIQDIFTSSKVPTAADLFRAISLDEINRDEIMRIMGLRQCDLEHLSARVFRSTGFNEPVKVKDRKVTDRGLDIDNCPLWLYTLLEAQKYPPREQPEEGGKAEDAGDLEKLGPLASFIVADVMSASISDAKTSIYKEIDVEDDLGVLNRPLQQLKEISLIGGRDFSFRRIKEFKF